MATITDPGRVAALDRFRDDLASGRAFALAEQSHRSRRLGCVLQRRSWAHVHATLARMAAGSDVLAQVAAAIAPRVNLYGTDGEECAHIYSAVLVALGRGYDDVIGRSGPEGGIYRTRDYTLAERALILGWCHVMVAPMESSVPGHGWALVAVAEECGVRLPEVAR